DDRQAAGFKYLVQRFIAGDDRRTIDVVIHRIIEGALIRVLNTAALGAFFGPQEQDVITTGTFSFFGYIHHIKEQCPAKVLAIAENGSFPQFNEMDTAKGNVDDRFAGSTLAPFRYGIEENIGAIVNAGVIMQVGQEYIVCNNGPLFVVQGGEAFQVEQQIVIECSIFLAEVAQDFGSTGNLELEVFLLRNGEAFCFRGVLLCKDKLSILEDRIDQLPIIIAAYVDKSGKVG
ncbi:MAG: hypothetical protein WCQ90_11625, partial [Deltaproteobacteria bacterium]